MNSIQKHYDSLLAYHYSWIYGGFDIKLAENEEFFSSNEIHPCLSKTAIDLGCGSGFQTLALAKSGFKIYAVDISEKLLDELKIRSKDQDIEVFQEDILEFMQKKYTSKAELITCMGDTLTHIENTEKLSELVKLSHSILETGGKIIFTFRDLTFKLKGTDRIIPVRAEENRIFTCFLEYENEYVNVTDVVYTRKESSWDLNKSSYKKLIIPPDLIKSELTNAGFKIDLFENNEGLISIIASK